MSESLDVPDGVGCTEIWEELSSRRRAEMATDATQPEDWPRISVVVCCHDVGRHPLLDSCIGSLTNQSRSPHEIVVVVDGDPDLADRVALDDRVDECVLNDRNRGLLASRNRGADTATGDVVAFIDDDARASPYWLAELARLYREHGAIAAGGKLIPDWESQRPWHLPDEFDWLVGATHRGFAPETVTEVRNTFGSNLSFRADVFDALDGFDVTMGGLKGDGQLQGGESELCDRLRQRYDEGVMYSPHAAVAHHVPDDRAVVRPCLRRAYWQGVSKARMGARDGAELDAEREFVGTVIRGAGLRIVRAASLLAYTAMVGTGYIVATLRQRWPSRAGDETAAEGEPA